MPIPTGKDWNFFREITTSNINFPTTPDVQADIKGITGFALINESTNGATIEFSFSGIVKHGHLKIGSLSQGFIFDNRTFSSIWFRSPSGLPATAIIMAWNGRVQGG